MGEVEISMNEEGALKVIQRFDLRVLLRRLRREDFERHRVVRPSTCSPWCSTASPPDFIRVLRVIFIFTLSLGLINIMLFDKLVTHAEPFTWDYIFGRTWLFGHFEIGQMGIVLLAMFAALLTVGVLVKNAPKITALARPRRGEVQTISALVQEV
ncbi:uncharacterized protein ABDE67_015700 [Symphorus nematophorus]